MLSRIKKFAAVALALCMVFSLAVTANAAEALSIDTLVSKTSEDLGDLKYKIRLDVPGADGSDKHDEVILMVDGSYSGDDEWASMVNTIVTIGETVLNGNGNTQLTLMAFGMGDNKVLVHVKDAAELEAALGELPGSLLYGRSSTNCESGFTGVAEYIAAHDDSLNDAHVLFISDGEINTDETPSNFYDWKNNGWHRFTEQVIIESNFEAECAAIAQGAARSNAFLTVFGEGDVETVCESATYEMMDTYNAQVWADVYAFAGLDPQGEYPVSTVERAFVDYDNTYNTYIQDNFYYALVGRSYPNRTDRTIAAANELAAQVASLYIVDTNGTTAWMQTAGGGNFVPAGSVSNIVSSIEGVLTDLSKTPFNDVVVTDYMSKWVNLDTDSLKVVNDVTGEAIWTVTDGWLIDSGRPTAKDAPVAVELVEKANYADGGKQVIGNRSGDIYKLTWYVKDGALLRSENYHLEYTVTVDVEEKNFKYGNSYYANGTTTVNYVDGDGSPVAEDIDVPKVKTDKSDKPECDKNDKPGCDKDKWDNKIDCKDHNKPGHDKDNCEKNWNWDNKQNCNQNNKPDCDKDQNRDNKQDCNQNNKPDCDKDQNRDNKQDCNQNSKPDCDKDQNRDNKQDCGQNSKPDCDKDQNRDNKQDCGQNNKSDCDNNWKESDKNECSKPDTKDDQCSKLDKVDVNCDKNQNDNHFYGNSCNQQIVTNNCGR